MKKVLFISFAVVLSLLTSMATANAALKLKQMVWWSTNGDKSCNPIYNAASYGNGGGVWGLFIEKSSTLSGNFINANPPSNINVPLNTGAHTYSFAGDAFESGQGYRNYSALTLEVYNDVTKESGVVGVWAPMDIDDASHGAPGCVYYYVSPTDIPPVYQDSQYKVTITNYIYSKDGDMGYNDWASPWTAVPNGRTDTVGRVTFKVEMLNSDVSGCINLEGFPAQSCRVRIAYLIRLRIYPTGRATALSLPDICNLIKSS